jgi:YHS domain-containing protein
MAHDPVCLAWVDEENPRFKSLYRDKEYFLCSNYCKKQFEKNPKRYTRIPSDINLGGSDTSC